MKLQTNQKTAEIEICVERFSWKGVLHVHKLLLLPSNRSSGPPFNGVISAGSWRKLEMVLFVFLLSDMERSLPVIM